MILVIAIVVLVPAVGAVRGRWAAPIVRGFTTLVGLGALAMAALVAVNATEDNLDSSVWFSVGLSVISGSIGLVLLFFAWKGPTTSDP